MFEKEIMDEILKEIKLLYVAYCRTTVVFLGWQMNVWRSKKKKIHTQLTSAAADPNLSWNEQNKAAYHFIKNKKLSALHSFSHETIAEEEATPGRPN